MNFTHSSMNSWSPIRRLGAAQRPPKATRPPVSANAIASHLVQVDKAPKDKQFERNVRDSWCKFCKLKDNNSPGPFTADELVNAMTCVKLGTAPGYDNIHPEFLKQLHPRGYDWLADFFAGVCHESQIPRMWKQAKVIALEKNGKDPKLASSYRPISLLSVCFKLLERVALQRVSPTVGELLSSDQVAALTKHIENGFQQKLKTGTVFLDLTAAYDTIWHTALLVKLSRCTEPWFVQLAELLLRKSHFRVHMESSTSSWRLQKNGLPQGSVLAPTLLNLHTNDLPVTKCNRFTYVDDICCAMQAKLSDERSLTSDMEKKSQNIAGDRG